ncbi:MAG: phosphatase PAP2 family protein [Bacillota bacterium]
MKKCIITIYALLASLLILGTFVDYELTKVLYAENSPFGAFMAWFIYIPTFFMAYFSLFVIDRPLIRSKIPYKYVTLGLLFLFYMILTYIFLELFIYTDSLVTIGILVGINAIAMVLTLLIPKDALYTFQKLALLYLVVLTLGYGIVSILKFLWGRERFYLLESPSDFSLWFIPQGIESGTRYNSFPSGHATAAAMTLIFVFIPLMFDSLKKYFVPVSIGVGFYIILGMLSRMMYGRHYLTDTVFSVLIVLSLFIYFYKVIHPNEEEIV